MAVHERTATHFPTFTHAAELVRREVSSTYVAIWFVATTVFALVHTGITVGASFWRYRADAAAHDGVVAAIDRFNAVSTTLPKADMWVWPQIGPAELDLDIGAAVGQVIAATAAFGLLLAIALVLLAHGRIVAGYVAALSTGLSVALMVGVLARVSPMIPVASDTDPTWLNLDQFPEPLRGPRVDLAAAMPSQDTATWWNLAIAMVVALLALAAVDVARRTVGAYDLSQRPAEPVVVDIAAVVVVGIPVVALLAMDLLDRLPAASQYWLLVAHTLLVAVLAARAAASAGRGTALALSFGFLLVHVLLYAAFHRGGGAPGGWGVGTGGPQVYATSGSGVLLVLAPWAGRIGADLWRRLPRPDGGADVPPVAAA